MKGPGLFLFIRVTWTIDQAEEEQTMRSTFAGSRKRIGLSVGAVILGLVLLGVTPVHAGIGGTSTPTWPTTATGPGSWSVAHIRRLLLGCPRTHTGSGAG